MKNKAPIASARARSAMLRHETRKFVSSELARIQKDEKSIHVAASDAARKGLLAYREAYKICRMIVVEMDRFPLENGGAA